MNPRELEHLRTVSRILLNHLERCRRQWHGDEEECLEAFTAGLDSAKEMARLLDLADTVGSTDVAPPGAEALTLSALLEILHRGIERSRRQLVSEPTAAAETLEETSRRCADLIQVVDLLVGNEQVPQ